jgi:hypothetical protein
VVLWQDRKIETIRTKRKWVMVFIECVLFTFV